MNIPSHRDYYNKLDANGAFAQEMSERQRKLGESPWTVQATGDSVVSRSLARALARVADDEQYGDLGKEELIDAASGEDVSVIRGGAYGPETLTQAKRWDRVRAAYVRDGLCQRCASQAAWGHQIGWRAVRRPCPDCQPLVEAFPVPTASGRWRCFPDGTEHGLWSAPRQSGERLSVHASP